MKLYLFFLMFSFLSLQSLNFCYSQNPYQCKLTNAQLGYCLKNNKKNIEATKEAKKVYELLQGITPKLVNFDYLMPCDEVTTFVAYFDGKTGDRVIFYPKKELIIEKLNNPSWETKGSLLHAIIHLQNGHSNLTNAYNNELEADQQTSELLKKLGATYNEAIDFLKINTPLNKDMPNYNSRLKLFESSYPPKPVVIQPNTEPKPKFNPKPTVVSEPAYNIKNDSYVPKQSDSFRLGIHAGINYSPNFDKFSFTGGLVLSYHPGYFGFQSELNYIKRSDEQYHSYSSYSPSWRNNVYYNNSLTYDVQNIELPIMLILGKHKQQKLGFNVLAGISLNFAIRGSVTDYGFVSYPNGKTESYIDNYPLDFAVEDYKRLQYKGTLGFILGNDDLCLGIRGDIGYSDYYDYNLDCRGYLMVRF